MTTRAVAALAVIAMALGGPARPAACQDAEENGPPAPEAIRALIEQMARDDVSGKQASEKLAEIGDAAVPLLVEATEHHVPRVRYWSIAALSSTGDPRGLVAIKRLLDDPVPLVRSVAVWHLGRWFDEPEVRQAVLAKLQDEDPSVRGWVLKLIQQKKAVDAADSALDVLRNDEDPEVRYDALTTFVHLKGRDALGVMTQALREDESPLVRECAVRCCALVAPPDPQTGDLLIRALRDKDEKVRDTAATLLRKGFDQYFGFDPEAPLTVRHEAIRKWRNWYDGNRDKLVWNEENQRFEAGGAAPQDQPPDEDR